MNETLDRLCRIAQTLKAHPEGLTVAQLAECLGINRARIRLDLELLTGDLPLTELEGEGAGARWGFIHPAGSLPVPAFTQAEVVALLALFDGEPSSRMESVKARLQQALFAQSGRDSLEQRKRRLLMKGNRPLYSTSELEKRVAGLEEAVLAERKVDLKYGVSALPHSYAAFEPYGLIYYWVWGFWYLVGKEAGGQLRTLRVDRIESFAPAGTFAYPEDFSLDECFGDAWGVELDGPLHDVTIRFFDEYNVVARVIRETNHRANRQLVRGEGSLLYTDRVRGLNEVKPWIRSFGSSAVVLSPQELREDMIRGARWVLEGQVPQRS